MSKAAGGASLAEKIRDTARTREPIETPLKTDRRVLSRVTDGIYRQPASAFRELVSNAYDADASEVIILTDAPRFSVISIRDDGIGLTPETLQHLIEHIGGSAKRTPEGQQLGVTAEDDPTRSPGGRQLIGKMGIGLFSIAQFTRHFLIITKRKGDRYRTVADITLGQVKDGADAANREEQDENEITSGYAQVWIEHASDVDAQGTEVKLLDLLPRTRAELASEDLWTKIDFEREADGRATTREPEFHIGRMNRQQPDEFLVPPKLPWAEKDKPRIRFENLVNSVRSLAATDKELVDLDAVCDRYIQTLWSIAIAAPLGYLDGHPFDLKSSDGLEFFQLENQTHGQSQLLEIQGAETPRRLLKLKAPCLKKGDRFNVFVDGVQLFRPIVFINQPTTENAVKTPLLFIGQCSEDFIDKPLSLSGGRLEFEAYLFWTPKVLPSQHQGVVVRVGNASGSPFDRTFMGYQVSEQTRLRQITAEIFVHEGLEGAINIDRESFNYAHPHYQFLVKWLHSALRQLTNRHKELGKNLRKAKLESAGQKAEKELEGLVKRQLKEHSVDDVPEVKFLEPIEQESAPKLRKQGILAFRRDTIIPEPKVARQSGQQKQQAAFLERKAVAVAQILQAWGLLEHLSYSDQERLVHDILEVTTFEAEQ